MKLLHFSVSMFIVKHCFIGWEKHYNDIIWFRKIYYISYHFTAEFVVV